MDTEQEEEGEEADGALGWRERERGEMIAMNNQIERIGRTSGKTLLDFRFMSCFSIDSGQMFHRRRKSVRSPDLLVSPQVEVAVSHWSGKR